MPTKLITSSSINEVLVSGYGTGLTNNQKAIGVCARAIEKQFDVKAYEFLINPSLNDRFKR